MSLSDYLQSLYDEGLDNSFETRVTDKCIYLFGLNKSSTGAHLKRITFVEEDDILCVCYIDNTTFHPVAEFTKDEFINEKGYLVTQINSFLLNIEDLKIRIQVLENAIRKHREKVQLVQNEDMDLWAVLGDGEQ